jgi:adenylate kinase family enzyme
MNSNKCQILILGNNAVGKTTLAYKLGGNNQLPNSDTKYGVNLDWIIKKGEYKVFVDIKERVIFNEKSYKNEISNIKENTIYIIVIKDIYNNNNNNNKQNIKSQIENHINYIPDNSIIILLINGNKFEYTTKINEGINRDYLDQIREIIWCNLHDEKVYDFKYLLEDIIINYSTDRLYHIKQKVRKNFETKEIKLDLGNCNLTNLLEIKELFNNIHLEELILSNEWAQYRNEKWHKITSENEKGKNTLGNFPSVINSLKNLKILNAGGDWNNRKQRWNRWNISSLKPLMKLSKLEYLNLSNNSIEVIPSLSRLKNLKILHLNNNYISKINNRKNLTSLKELYLSNNSIKTTSFLNKFPSLKTIDLHGNEIKSLLPIREKIELLNISNTKWEQNTINIAKNPLEQPPMEMVNIGKGGVINYFNDIEGGQWYINKDIKLILIGNSEVGKTTLAKYLNNEIDLDKPHHPTHWMQQRRLKSKNIIPKIKEKCNINLFDFGGHDYFHDTHHLFFGHNTMYLLIWDTETNRLNSRSVKQTIKEDSSEKVITQDYPLKYWLDSIEYYTREKETENFEFEIEIDVEYSSKVIIIQNKVDKLNKTFHLNNLGLSSKYPFISDFINISLLPKRNLNHLDLVVTESLNETEILGVRLAKYYGVIKREISNYKGAPILSMSDFRNYCSSQTTEPISNKRATYLAKYLNQIGTILYNPKSHSPSKVYIDKKWVIEKIHSILTGLNKLKGEFDDDYLKSIWKNNVSKAESSAIINLMIEFKMIFINPNSKKYIAPLYLPSKPIESVNIFIDSTKIPYRKIRYTGFIHKNVILNFFQEYGKLAIKEKSNVNNERFYYWKNGLIIKDSSSAEVVMILFNLGDNEGNASIDIIKLNIESQTLFVDKIIEYIHEINKGYDTEEMITNNGKEFIPISVIHENEKKQNWTFKYNSNYFKLKDFKEHLKNTNTMKKIFISYSKQDLKLVNKFIDHLSALKQDGKVASWYCSELIAGTDWDSEINKHFEDSDIICFMVSPNFMRTQYIHEFEIAKAFERKAKDPKFIIVPIILDFCRWSTEKNNLSQYTALPYTTKPIVDFDNQNKAWYIVEECLRLIIDENIDVNGKELYENKRLPQDILKIYEGIISGKEDKK